MDAVVLQVQKERRSQAWGVFTSRLLETAAEAGRGQTRAWWPRPHLSPTERFENQTNHSLPWSRWKPNQPQSTLVPLETKRTTAYLGFVVSQLRREPKVADLCNDGVPAARLHHHVARLEVAVQHVLQGGV